jgi:delta 1-pyrroline-5-carboxylate dehydrogenase
MNQIVCKVASALAAGCTMVLKPSELARLSAYLFAQILDEAGLPAGVFNMVNGDGPTVGSAIASHPDVAMVSFTGSTRASVAVASAAAPTVKRVTQELGGKSANIILDDADLEKAVKEGVQGCFRNTGQSCNAPTRMLVPRSKMAETAVVAKQEAEATKTGDPFTEGTDIGPLASKAQFEKVQHLIKKGIKGIEEGAELISVAPVVEDLLAGDCHIVANIREYGRLHEVALTHTVKTTLSELRTTPLMGCQATWHSEISSAHAGLPSEFVRATYTSRARDPTLQLVLEVTTVGQRPRMGRGWAGRIP